LMLIRHHTVASARNRVRTTTHKMSDGRSSKV
jgi:hypothetical protein